MAPVGPPLYPENVNWPLLPAGTYARTRAFLTTDGFSVDPEEYRKRQEQVQRQRALELIRQREAEATARKLLLSKLTEAQRGTLEKEKYFTVLGSKGNSYRISCDRISHNVWQEGEPGITYCAYPPGVPRSDTWLAQKLLIETDEEAFLKVAIRSGHNIPDFALTLQNLQLALGINRE